MLTTSPPRAAPAPAALYRVAGMSAAVTAALIPVQVVVFLVWPPPLDGTAADWIGLLRAHRLAGLVDLDLLLVVDNVLLVPLLLALYGLLGRVRPSAMLLATAGGLASAVLYVATNPALAGWQGTAFHAGYLLGSAAGVTVGAVMLRSPLFGRAAGWLGIAANAVGLGLYVPGVGVYISVFSVVFLEIWYVLVARRLLTLRFADAGPRVFRP